jgi:hypothetical protein
MKYMNMNIDKELNLIDCSNKELYAASKLLSKRGSGISVNQPETLAGDLQETSRPRRTLSGDLQETGNLTETLRETCRKPANLAETLLRIFT